MSSFVALLRAVNVGGRNKVNMSELRRLFEAMGFGRVQTYIQSGNVLFSADAEAGDLARRIEEQIAATFGLSVAVVVRTVAELERVIAASPFDPGALSPEESLYVALLAAEPVGALADVESGSDEFRLVGREVYLLYHQPSHKSKLTNSFLEKKLGVVATTRNWQTLCKLVELGKAMT